MPVQQQARFVANIRSEAERIARIVDRMLELARLEVRREKPDMEPVDLNALVRTVVESHEPLLASKDVKMEIAVPDGLSLAGNAFLLHQALENLVQNAIEFSPGGGIVRVAVAAERDRVTISVTDVPRGDIPRIDTCGSRRWVGYVLLHVPLPLCLVHAPEVRRGQRDPP